MLFETFLLFYRYKILVFFYIETGVFTLEAVIALLTGTAFWTFFPTRTPFFFVVKIWHTRIITAGVIIASDNTIIKISLRLRLSAWEMHFWAEGYSSTFSQGLQAQWLQFKQPSGHCSWQGHSLEIGIKFYSLLKKLTFDKNKKFSFAFWLATNIISITISITISINVKTMCLFKELIKMTNARWKFKLTMIVTLF